MLEFLPIRYILSILRFIVRFWCFLLLMLYSAYVLLLYYHMWGCRAAYQWLVIACFFKYYRHLAFIYGRHFFLSSPLFITSLLFITQWFLWCLIFNWWAWSLCRILRCFRLLYFIQTTLNSAFTYHVIELDLILELHCFRSGVTFLYVPKTVRVNVS